MDDHLDGARPRRQARWPISRSKSLNWAVAAVSWASALLALVIGVWSWALGRLTLETFITIAFVAIGGAIGGALALSGDGDVMFFTGMDEGQRSAMYGAMAPAFSLAVWGLIALWLAYEAQPAWRADAYLHVGGLLLLVICTYLGGYLWRRRHI